MALPTQIEINRMANSATPVPRNTLNWPLATSNPMGTSSNFSMGPLRAKRVLAPADASTRLAAGLRDSKRQVTNYTSPTSVTKFI